MCGIIGSISNTNVTDSILEGLKRLEYRGYDSAGIATIDNNTITRCRAEGKIRNLETALQQQPLKGHIGIGHTRWATHGAPKTHNAHPHATSTVAVVHNGIIENFQELKTELLAQGCVFESETDTEVVAHLLTVAVQKGQSPADAMRDTLKQLRGAFALAVLFTATPHVLYGARRGSPLVVGYGEHGLFLGSDALALAPFTQKITYLQEDDWVMLTDKAATIIDANGTVVQRSIVETGLSGAMIGKGRHRHFMLKEIYEQPTVLGDTLQAFYNAGKRAFSLPLERHQFQRIQIVACGTSYHAGSVARYWLEEIAGIPTSLDIASEFRYRPFLGGNDTLCLVISQSGETADTLAALRYAKQHNAMTVAVVNVASSSMAREADVVLLTRAGPEIGVASTKAFTTQLTVLAMLALALKGDEAERTQTLLQIPDICQQILRLQPKLIAVAETLINANSILYIGRGTSYPIAAEGALKLKELSYIHAEGLAAGELKHGPIALIDETVPIIALAPYDQLFEKTASNIQEIAARHGRVVLFSSQQGCDTLRSVVETAFVLPDMPSFISPILYTLPVQLLAYHVAVLKGMDVDQPRNLAKSVTVE